VIDFAGQPLTEAELLSICLAPYHPTREHGLTVRRVQRFDDRISSPPAVPSTSTKNMKRASSISILSGLGVRDPERALDPPSPTSEQSNPAMVNAKRPSKLRNFFGQRPPSELITNHLTEYFPNAEKKVLERTARHSMMIRSGTISSKRHSTSSNQPLPSRFSSSTQGSGRRSFSPSGPSSSTLPPPVPEKVGSHDLVEEDLPRMSLSTEDGRSLDLLEETPNDVEKPQLLPPIPFPTESLSESMEGITGGIRQRPVSRSLSIASKRMSYMTELRSKRDRSDTASLMTVDEITAEVESRASNERETDFDDWTKVDAEIENMVPKAVEIDEDEDEDEDSEDEGLVDEEDETLHEEEELSLDVDDHGCIRNIMSARRGTFVELVLSIMSDLGITSK